MVSLLVSLALPTTQGSGSFVKIQEEYRKHCVSLGKPLGLAELCLENGFICALRPLTDTEI